MSVWPRPLEKEVQKYGVGLLRSLGFAVYNLSQARASKQTPGLGDSFICGHGITAWVEWKRPGETQSKEQLAFELEVKMNGGTYLLFGSAGDVVNWWNAFKR